MNLYLQNKENKLLSICVNNNISNNNNAISFIHNGEESIVKYINYKHNMVLMETSA